MVSYKNDSKLKADFVKEIQKHRKADMIIQGTYGRENGHWKGCAVACSLRSLAILKGEPLVEQYQEHKRYESELGVPEWLARLEDSIFEQLPKEKAMLWPEQFAKSIPVGVDLEPVKWKFCAFLLKENIDRVLNLKINDDLKKQVVDSIRGVLVLHEEAIKTGKWDARSAARSAASAASAARSAAWSAERSAESAESAASAAWSAARSAARSAESAAWSAARSAAWSAARSAARSAAWSAARSAESAAYIKYSKELLKLLKNS